MSQLERYEQELEHIREAGLYKHERFITSPQQVEIEVEGGQQVLNFCANNYLGLADDPQVIQAAHEALDRYGFGMASVRFICGTLDLHKALERQISEFFGLTTRFCTAHVLTPTGACSRLCWSPRTP